MLQFRNSQYYIWLRVVAMIVVVAFITTQSDLQLAFAYVNAAPPPSSLSPNQTTQKDLFDDIRYSDDFRQPKPELNKPEIDLQSFEAKPIEKPIEPFQMFKEDSGLLQPTQCAQENFIKTCESESAYYKVDTQNNRIIEMADYTNPRYPDQVEIKEFRYGVEKNGSAENVLIVTRGMGGEKDKFQIYSYLPGTYDPDLLLSYGNVKLVEGQEQLEEIRNYNWDWEKHELTVVDVQAQTTQIWQLLDKKIGELVLFQGPYDHDHTALEIEQAPQFSCLISVRFGASGLERQQQSTHA